MQCDKCGVETTVEKWITSKKTGKNYKVYECQSCMNGKFKYSFFPPRDSAKASYSAPQQVPQSNEVIERLKRIEAGIAELNKRLGAPVTKTITTDEMEPDMDLPPF